MRSKISVWKLEGGESHYRSPSPGRFSDGESVEIDISAPMEAWEVIQRIERICHEWRSADYSGPIYVCGYVDVRRPRRSPRRWFREVVLGIERIELRNEIGETVNWVEISHPRFWRRRS